MKDLEGPAPALKRYSSEGTCFFLTAPMASPNCQGWKNGGGHVYSGSSDCLVHAGEYASPCLSPWEPGIGVFGESGVPRP